MQDVESVTSERAVEISQATTERQEEALVVTTDTVDKDDQEITVSVEQEEVTGKEMVDNVEFEEAIAEDKVEETVSSVEEAISKIASLRYPTDPIHNQAFDLKCNASYLKMCVDIGPCQPVLRFPKNAEGRSFQKTWYENKPISQYSPDKDSMYCFSCRLFLNEPKYKSMWRVAGVKNWKRGLERACRLRGPLNKHGAMEHIQKECFRSSF